jgi:hypothetical protein
MLEILNEKKKEVNPVLLSVFWFTWQWCNTAMFFKTFRSKLPAPAPRFYLPISEPIPAPEVIESNSETAWAAFLEASEMQQEQYAPTQRAPLSV